MDNKYVFISYSHNDSEKVVSIINALKARGIDIWYDEGIEAGTEWPEYIAEKIYGASVFIAFMTPSAAASMNCRNEINYAISLGKEMLIVYLEPTTLSAGMQLQLGSIQAMFYNRSKNDVEFIENLLRSRILQNLLFADDPSAQKVTSIFDAVKQQEKASAPLTTVGVPVDNHTSEASDRDCKLRLIYNILIPLIAVMAVSLGVLEMHLVTKYVESGFLVFLLGVIAPLLVFVPFYTVCRLKMQGYSSEVCSHIDGSCYAYTLIAFIVQVIADASYIHSTDKVFLKILISLGINIVAYFITFITVPTKK